MIFNKYKIHHIDLATEVKLPDVEGASHYFVFWYRSIPLGDRYFTFKSEFNEDHFWQSCLDALWPALEYYHKACKDRGILHKPQFPNAVSIRFACEQVFDDQETSVPDKADISVVICTRNRASWLRRCLEHLSHQVCKPLEIVVVDNGSTSNDTRNVAMEFANVRYVREDRPGLDIARNRGAHESRGAIVAYTDDDTLPDPHWVYRINETFRNPVTVAMTGLVIAASLETEAEVIFERYWPFNRGYVPRIFGRNFFNATLESGPPVWEIGAGANMAFRKGVFEEVGYFDERLDVGAAGCSGDSEMWYRILANGFEIQYNPLAVVHHSHRNSISDLKRQLHSYMRGFTVAILIQHQRFGHKGNLKHLLRAVPAYYLSLLRRGFPRYEFQYKTLFSELGGIFSGLFYYWRHRDTDPRIFN